MARPAIRAYLNMCVVGRESFILITAAMFSQTRRRAENIAENGGQRPNRSRNYRVLRQISLDYPPLTRAVWRILGDEEPHRRWDASVRLDAS